MAAAAAKRDKSQSHLLHDFSSPVLKSWGSHRLIRCDGVVGDEEYVSGKHRSAPPPNGRRLKPTSGCIEISIGDKDGGLGELREKLMGHLREVSDTMKVEVPTIDSTAAGSPEVVRPSTAGESAIPWNLRTRRRASQRITMQGWADRTIRLRYGDSEKEEQQKFSVSLTLDEIEEDVFALTGSRPRRRPKKRARIVQRQLDAIFPGLWLSEMSPESYRVPE